MIITANNANELYKTIINLLSLQPDIQIKHNICKELINLNIELTDIDNCIITESTNRNLKLSYLFNELVWYLFGDQNITFISKHASTWEYISYNHTVNSNYGFICLKQHLENYSGNQVDWVIDKLTEDKETRQALINFNQPKHKSKEVKDFVCTISQQFFIRDNKLLSIVNVRSNDIIYGWSYDLPFFCFIQKIIYMKMLKIYPNLELGSMFQNIASMHIYQRHFKFLK